MDGVQLPLSGQVPLLDTHDGTSVKNVLLVPPLKAASKSR